jgi:phosphatidylserine/phosphatidylglycerophosphate/cardiolipin synthase-like enzyme
MNKRWTAMAVVVGYGVACGCAVVLAPSEAWARKSSMERLVEKEYANLAAEHSVKVESAGELEVAFSPNGGSTDLVIKVIHSAKTSIRVLAYSFTSAPIAQALVEAHKRGVDVQVVVDKSQKKEKYTSATFVANAGIPIRIDSKHAIAHNKVVIVDGHTVQQGSFNYTKAAEEKNGENVLVNWNNAKLAEVYLKDWKRHWEHSDAVAARY